MLYRLRPGADTLEPLRHPLFHSLRRLAPSPDGRVLYLADYSHGMLRVDLETREVTRLDDAPSSTSLGCDGIAWDRGAIVAVQNGVAPARIMRFVLDQAGRRIQRADVLDRDGGSRTASAGSNAFIKAVCVEGGPRPPCAHVASATSTASSATAPALSSVRNAIGSSVSYACASASAAISAALLP